jgi:hypothetical protein
MTLVLLFGTADAFAGVGRAGPERIIKATKSGCLDFLHELRRGQRGHAMRAPANRTDEPAQGPAMPG